MISHLWTLHWAPECQPHGKMSMSYRGQQDRDVCFVIVALMTSLSFLGTLQHNNRWKPMEYRIFLSSTIASLYPFELWFSCIQVQVLMLLWNHSWGEETFCVTLIWFTGNCRSWKYLRDYPVYLLIFLDEKTVQGLSNMFRVTQCLIWDKNLVLISNPVLFS